jgi:DNA-binding GntR family transcriptional regulator
MRSSDETTRAATVKAKTVRRRSLRLDRNDDLPLGKRAAEALRRAIVTGRYKPGERMVEARLSAELGISRIPIREALRTLAAEGLVLLLPNRGARVAAVSPELAADLVEVRSTLEGLNARLAARHGNRPLVEELRSVLAEGNKAAKESNVADLVRLNAEFHDKLAEAGGNAILWDIMRTLRERTGAVFARNTAARAVQDWDEHSQILAAVIEGDEELASLLATRHVRLAGEAALAAAAQAAPAGVETK